MLAKPNLTFPLAYSYDGRGINPNTTMLNGQDQRKVNCLYQTITNSFTGAKENIIVKRSGCSPYQDALNGTTTQVQYSITRGCAGSNITLVGAQDGSGNIVVLQATDVIADVSATIDTDADLVPGYLVKGSPAGPDVVVLQLTEKYVAGTNPAVTMADNFYYTTDNDTWTNITDVDFVGATDAVLGECVIMDGYMFVLKSDNKIQHSDHNDITSWEASSIIAKTIIQDIPVGLARFRNQILAFGSESVEVFYNKGNTTGSVLERLPHLSAKVGLKNLSHGKYTAEIGSRLYFLGGESGSADSTISSLYAYDGSRFEKIYSSILDRILKSNIVYNMGAFPWADKHAIYMQLTPSTSTTGHRWLVFCPDDNEWFEWTSDVFQPINNGISFCGGSKSGATTCNSVYLGDLVAGQDSAAVGGGTMVNYPFTLQFKLPVEDGLPHTIPYFGLIGDTNTTETLLTIEKSSDDYQNFTNVGNIDLSKKRKIKYGLGMFQSAPIVRLSYTGANTVRLSKAYANAT
jgi:hypothetical protein